jgi:hypothetical protein
VKVPLLHLAKCPDLQSAWQVLVEVGAAGSFRRERQVPARFRRQMVVPGLVTPHDLLLLPLVLKAEVWV